MPTEPRQRTAEECKEHDDRLTHIEEGVHKNAGRFTAMLWFMGVLGSMLALSMGYLITKTTAIEALLTDNKLIINLHTEQINNLKSDVKEIQERHRYIDQNGIAARPRR